MSGRRALILSCNKLFQFLFLSVVIVCLSGVKILIGAQSMYGPNTGVYDPRFQSFGLGQIRDRKMMMNSNNSSLSLPPRAGLRPLNYPDGVQPSNVQGQFGYSNGGGLRPILQSHPSIFPVNGVNVSVPRVII